MEKDLRDAALDYHRYPSAGKISVTPTKALTNQRDLSLAYSPGVAAACEAIADDPAEADRLTARGNLVGVITNGTAVLGLGNIGPLASKPVMEGKGCLFKKFAGIDVFDIELAENDPDKLIDIIAALEPTLGGINLEDIKAPECFYIEQKLKERMKIPVFHDDQHGTAIIATAALINSMKVVKKDIGEVKLVCSGAGAAAIACLDMMVRVGVNPKNVFVCDSKGVIWEGREPNMEANKKRYAQNTEARTLADAIADADVFLGCSTAGVLKPEMLKTMAASPVVLALANPTPEIMPDLALEARPDCIIATGRSDFPNQVNNVLGFPYIFRGALDVGATSITDEMKLACVHAIADLALAEQSDEVAMAYGGQELRFGPNYIIPKPFDPRLIVRIAPAVAEAAMNSGVATRPIQDIEAYRAKVADLVYRTGTPMRPVVAAARQNPKRVIYAEGEDERVIRALQIISDEKIARPILIGRAEVIQQKIADYDLRIRQHVDFEVINPEDNPYFQSAWEAYTHKMVRRGVPPDIARFEIRRDPTLLGAMLVDLGHADALVCGTHGRYEQHLHHVRDVFGLRPGAQVFAAMNMLMLPQRILFITDTYVNETPSAEQMAEITEMAAEVVRRFGILPKAALLSHSNFGSSNSCSAQRVRAALALIRERCPELEVEGELHGDSALSEDIRAKSNPESLLKGEANLLVMPNLDAANITFNLFKVAGGEGVTVGPILLGAAKPVHILTPTASVRRVVNISALAVVEASTRN